MGKRQQIYNTEDKHNKGASTANVFEVVAGTLSSRLGANKAKPLAKFREWTYADEGRMGDLLPVTL